MKKTITFFISLSSIIILCSTDLAVDYKPNEETAIWYKKSIIELSSSLEDFKQNLISNEEKKLDLYYRRCRSKYKKIEFLFFYLNSHDVETYINGAPLPKLALDTDLPDVISPEGFQVIDELMVEIDSEEARLELKKQLTFLIERINRISLFQTGLFLTDRQIFEAMRLEIITISTLGISGFDTPGTSMGLIDASISLSQLKWCFELYKKELNQSGFRDLAETIDLFDAGLEQLQVQNFDSFDRFSFTKEVLNKISTNLLNAQNILSIEFRDEVDHMPSPVNQRASHLYSADFFDKNFFLQEGGSDNSLDILELGRILFFDPILSSNNQRACASCHSPEKAFTENLPKSLAFDGRTELKRNSMSLVNATHTQQFFYDLRAGSLTTQFEHVITNGGEFNTNYIELEKKLSNCQDYVGLFQEAFNTSSVQVKKEQINRSLAAYVSSLTAYNSEFDKMMRDEIMVDKDVSKGYNLFMGKAMCGTCHFPPSFAGLRPPFYKESESEILGITQTDDFANPVLDNDLGRKGSGRPIDDFDFYANSFKTVSVRNSQLTSPYFHNGSFSSLDKVLEFYNAGGGAGLGLNVPLQTLSSDSLNLSEEEQKQIIHFLHSLTDIEGLTDVPANLPTCSESHISKRSLGGKY